LPISAVDTITPAINHTKAQLFQRFRFGQWTRLALVGLLAGEMGSSGSFNLPSNIHIPQQGGSHRLMAAPWSNIDPMVLASALTILVIAGFVFFILFAYISSVMRFILFDSILAKECHIRAGWSRRMVPGWRLFLWHIGLLIVFLLAGAVIFGIPIGFAFTAGLFKAPSQHMAPLIIGGIFLFFAAVIFMFVAALIHVLTKDFVVPQMALENIGAVEGWRRLWAMMRTEKGGYAGYIGMKIVLAIAAGIVIGIASVIVTLLIAVPVAGIVIASVFAGKSAGLTWNVFTITAAVVVICIFVAIVMYVVSLLSVPAIVFFPAYSIYFFASRYQPLSLVLYSPAVAPAPLPPFGGVPPHEPPPLPPTPEPIG
jgi:hypothetical protein